MNPIYFNLTPDGINYLTINSMLSSAELVFAPLYNSNTPEAQQQLFYTFSDDPTNCVININNSTTQGTLIVNANTLTVTWYSPSSPTAWNLGSYGDLSEGVTLKTSMQLAGSDPAQYLGTSLTDCLVSTPQQWTFSVPLVLALNTVYSINPSDQTDLILTEAQSLGGDSIPVELETAIAAGQVWTINQGTLSNGVVTNAQVLTGYGSYLAGVAAGQAVNCSDSWAGSWTITDNGDGTATFECLASDGTSLGFLTSNGASGAPTLQPSSGATNQKWKFTSAGGKKVR